MLEVRRERPIRVAHAPPQPVVHIVHHQQTLVHPITKNCQPACKLHHAIELVAVQHQKLAPIRRGMHHFVFQTDRGNPVMNKRTQKLIVITTNVGYLRATLCPFKQQVHNLVVECIPIPAFAQGPTVNNIADQIQMVGLIVLQKIKQKLGFTPTRTEMCIRNPDTAIFAEVLVDAHWESPLSGNAPIPRNAHSNGGYAVAHDDGLPFAPNTPGLPGQGGH